MSTEIKRESRDWWAVTEHGVQLVTGWRCGPYNETSWWCPKAGFTMSEGHHLFETKKAALAKAITESTDKLRAMEEHLSQLMKEYGSA